MAQALLVWMQGNAMKNFNVVSLTLSILTLLFSLSSSNALACEEYLTCDAGSICTLHTCPILTVVDDGGDVRTNDKSGSTSSIQIVDISASSTNPTPAPSSKPKCAPRKTSTSGSGEIIETSDQLKRAFADAISLAISSGFLSVGKALLVKLNLNQKPDDFIGINKITYGVSVNTDSVYGIFSYDDIVAIFAHEIGHAVNPQDQYIPMPNVNALNPGLVAWLRSNDQAADITGAQIVGTDNMTNALIHVRDVFDEGNDTTDDPLHGTISERINNVASVDEVSGKCIIQSSPATGTPNASPEPDGYHPPIYQAPPASGEGQSGPTPDVAE